MARVSLASVRGPRENAFLTTQLASNGTQAWLGLHLVRQTYLWVDEEELTFTSWDVGEPSGDQQTGCVHMYGRGANAGRWNDVDCSRRMGWICESTRFPYWNVPVTPPSRCPAGFQRLSSSCYQFSNATRTRLPWSEAEQYCATRGGHLASVDSRVEQDFVYLGITGGEPEGYVYRPSSSRTVYPSVWLGLRGTRVNNAILWQWSDGWPVTFSNWGPGGDLNPGNATNLCVTMDSNGTWHGQDCLGNRPFVCEINSDKPPYTQNPTSGVCEGHGWTAYASHCYAFYVTERVTFAHADFTCSQQGASLVSIHSQATNQFLQTQAKARSAVPLWIGFRRPDQGAYSWRDGSSVDFTNWDTNNPKGTGGDGSALRCGQLSPWNGRWIDDECSAKFGYICMKSKVYETSTQRAVQNTSRTALRSGRLIERKRLRPVSHSGTATPYPPGSTTTTTPAQHPAAPTPHSHAVLGREMSTKVSKPAVSVGPDADKVDARTDRNPSTVHPNSVTSGGANPVAGVTGFDHGTPAGTGKKGNQGSSPNTGGNKETVLIPAVTAGVVVVVLVVALGVWLALRRCRGQSVATFTRRLYERAT
ncbi:macrophage mannose receptor 1-like [Babylonia areolata]|uniref:macrophage mannose receptor 1-like n=1 Tax=Babylonia areolata TaxID=304850 RepID=UPI003FD4E9DB